MADSKAKSFAGQIQLLMGTEPDFPHRFKQRLVLESSRVANPVKFIVELFSKGVLCDGSGESGASFGLKETMVQLALLIVSSKGADAMGGLMEAFEESGNSLLVSDLQAWVVKDCDIQTDADLSEGKGNGSAVQPLASEMTAKPQKIPNEFSSSGPKLIDKLMSHEETDLMEQRVKNSFLEVHKFPDTSFVCGPTYVDVYETESGKLMKDEKNLPCYIVAGQAGRRTWNMGDLVSGRSVAVAGGQNGAISIWNTSKLSCKQYPTKTFRGHDTGILSLCLLNGHLLSLDKSGDLLMFSGHDLEKEKLKPIPRILLESSTWTDLASHERWLATWSSNDDMINIWTVPDLWLRTG